MTATRSYRRFVLNVFASAGGRIIAILLGLALATVLVRTLGLAGYGTWSFFYAAIGYAALFDLGLSVAVERTVARFHYDRSPRGIERTLNLGVTAALVLSLLLQALLELLPDRWLTGLGDLATVRTCLRLLPLCLFFSNVGAVVGAGLSGLQEITRLNAIRVGFGALTTIAVIALVFAGVRSVPVLLVAYSTGLLLTGVWIWIVLRAHVDELRFRPVYVERDLARELARFGGAVQASNLALQLGDQLFRAMLGAHFGAATMGAYDLAARAGYVLRSLSNALLGVMVPFGTAHWLAGGREALARLHTLAVKYTALFMLGGTAVALLESRPLLTIWLGAGDGVSQVLTFLQVLLVANALQALVGPMVALGRAAGRAVPEAVMSGLGNGIGLLIAWTVAATPAAAILAFMGALTVATFAAWVWLRRLLDLRLSGAEGGLAIGVALRLLLTVATAAALAWGADTLIRRLQFPDLVSMAGAGLAAAVGLALGIVLLRVLGPDERHIWRALLAGRRPDGG